MPDCPDAGMHGAAEERGAIEGHLIGDLDHRSLVYQHLCGEPAEADEGSDRHSRT